MRIGLYGGTFNPIHNGHINLALELQEIQGLDEVWFIPAQISPLRLHEELVSAENRVRMLELALEPIEGFSIQTLELKRPPPSYTIDTLQVLITQYPEHTFYLLLGEDSILRFSEWREALKITQTLPILVGSRSKAEVLKKIHAINLDEAISAAILKGVISTRLLDISASEIRNRLKKRLYCGHLLPPKVLDFIYANQLYFNALT